MTAESIKKELSARGIEYKDLVAELGVTRGAISLIINGKSVSDRVQRAIAEKLGRAPEDLFPEYYSRRINKITKPEEREKARGNP
jgi:transcriptional regulator with XRE-family HTH domain